MKKLKFYATAFAALMLAASCQDEALDAGKNSANGENTAPAYLTIAFTTNGESSTRATADDANNHGDTDGDQEDSGHSNAGTDNEQSVDKVLVVITPANGGNVNFARLYTTSTSKEQDPDNSGIFDVTNTAAGSTFANNEPIELTTGEYNVVVVANPVADLTTGIAEDDLNTGIQNSNAVENLYNKITNEYYTPGDENFPKIAAGEALTTGENFRIMMASKALSNEPGQTYSVQLDENDTPENPATVTVNIERAYSKITFRETKLNDKANVYEVPVYVGEVQARLVDAAIDESELQENEEGTDSQSSDPSYVYRQLNAALDAKGHPVYVLWEAKSEDDESPEFKGVFGATGKTVESIKVDDDKDLNNVEVYTKLEAVTDESSYKEGTNYVIATSGEPTSGLTYLSDEVAPAKKWYVELIGYSLVNLSKNVYYVRHTTDNMGQSPFGTLTGNNFLYTPYWSEKNDDNNFTTGTNGEITFKTEGSAPISEKWFYNTLAQVSEESKTLTIDENGALKNNGQNPTYYKAMPTGDDQGSVSGDKDQHPSSGNTLPNVGKFMSYCFENSTDIEHQMHGISTGISFVARIYSDASCTTAITRLYRYSNHLFQSLEAIQKSYGANTMSKKFNELVEKEKGGTTITKQDMADLAAYKSSDSSSSSVGDANKSGETIDLYDSGICYYYTTEIKHYDNGDNASLGNMEFAIMRNNIYSLAVTGINEIGDPFVDPTPNTPNEDTTQKTALNVEVKIVPWIVRYNDIEF